MFETKPLPARRNNISSVATVYRGSQIQMQMHSRVTHIEGMHGYTHCPHRKRVQWSVLFYPFVSLRNQLNQRSVTLANYGYPCRAVHGRVLPRPELSAH